MLRLLLLLLIPVLTQAQTIVVGESGWQTDANGNVTTSRPGSTVAISTTVLPAGVPVSPDAYASIAAAYAAAPASGAYIYVPSSRTETVSLALAANKPLRLECASGVVIAWNTAGFYITVGEDRKSVV